MCLRRVLKRQQKDPTLEPATGNSRCSAARMSSEEMEADEPMLYPEAVGKEMWGYLCICTKTTPPLLQNHRDLVNWPFPFGGGKPVQAVVKACCESMEKSKVFVFIW